MEWISYTKSRCRYSGKNKKIKKSRDLSQGLERQKGNVHLAVRVVNIK